MKGVFKIMMTRKHYIKIANAIKENTLYKPSSLLDSVPRDIDYHGLIDSLCYVFKCDNSNFDSQRFRDYTSGMRLTFDD